MADDLTRPFVGYRSAGRRPESQQDRRAAADAPLSALRGMVSGVLGAPGDIESLIRMLPGLSERTVLPTSEDVEKRLPMRELNQTPTGRAFTTAGQLGGGFYTGPGSPLRAIAALPSAVSRAGRDFLMSTSPVHVIKPKGGNWMAGSVERAVEPMKRGPLDGGQKLIEAGLVTPEQIAKNPDVAMNKWLDQKLSKYIRNEMATPEDPLRALAERGVLHVDPQQVGMNRYLASDLRRKSGSQAMGESEAAKAWEDASDVSIGKITAGQLLQQGYAEQMPWLAKVPPETPVYMPSQSNAASNLGFSHLTDELRNAINPESGLPANLQWKYSDLEKVTVPQAVERVAKINDWRAAQKAEADMARAMNRATQVVKEYPEQGMRWVELRAPEVDMKSLGYTTEEVNGVFHAVDPEGNVVLNTRARSADEALKRATPEPKELADALKYEGETMGHCVGGYCPDVVEGRSKIYSLRDKKGQPHVTIEVQPGKDKTGLITADELPPEELADMKRRNVYDPNFMYRFNDQMRRYLPELGPFEPSIVQIKGKANLAPNPEYLPAVQDFVRSQNWGRIGDLQNAGLIDIQDPNAVLRALGKISPERNIQQAIDNFNTAVDSAPNAQRYMSLDEMRDFLGGPSPEGFAQGGLVDGANSPTDDFDPARIDAIVGELHAMNAS